MSAGGKPGQTGLRVSNLYGTWWRAPHDRTDPDSLTASLSFDHLAPHYGAAADQLPAVLMTQPLTGSAVSCRRWLGGAITAGRLWLFVTPPNQVVVGLTLDLADDADQAIPFLEDCYYLDLSIQGTPIATFAAQLAAAQGVRVDEPGFADERYQIVYPRTLRERPADALIRQLIYRSEQSPAPEFAAIAYPGELNRRPRTIGALGPHGSVMCGHPPHVENAALVSSAHAVASAVRLRGIRDSIFRELREFRLADTDRLKTRDRRLVLERVTDRLTQIELDLTVSVEAPGDIGALVPSLRAAAYHGQVFTSFGVLPLAEAVSKMLRRLESIGRSELASVESVEQRANENRRLRWSVAVGFVSTVAIPVTLIFTYFSTSGAHINEELSMFDSSYLRVYAAIGLLVIIAIALWFVFYVIQAREYREESARSTNRQHRRGRAKGAER